MACWGRVLYEWHIRGHTSFYPYRVRHGRVHGGCSVGANAAGRSEEQMSAALAVSASKGAALLVGLGPIWLTVLLVSLIVSSLTVIFFTILLMAWVLNWFDTRIERLWKHTEKEN